MSGKHSHTEPQKFEIEFGGRPLVVESGLFAQQAHGSCTVRYGDTIVLATAVMGQKAREGMNYFPLTVDYEERLYAAGKIKGSRFIKREGRPSDDAILTARLIDRSIRPLFDSRIRNEIQVVLTVLSWDGENSPDIPAMLATSLALSMSPIPWKGGIAGIKVGLIDGEWVINPTYSAEEKSDLELTLAFTEDKKLIMVEAGANEVPEDKMIEAHEFGHKHIGKLFELASKVTESLGKEKVQADTLVEQAIEETEEETSEELEQHQQIVREVVDQNVDTYLFGHPVLSKGARKAKMGELRALAEEKLIEAQVGKEKRSKALGVFDAYVEEHITKAIIERDQRVDGRSLTEIRALASTAGLLPRVHGSGLFNRGETQVLSIVTLGSPGAEQIIDTMEEDVKKRYMHHYNFPGYSVGEPKRMMGPGRREIGHGALAEKALLPVLPTKEEFPYTIRVVSEIMGSNGSSSMGSVCGSTLALMDAGVPIKKPVAGLAMGLASNDKGEYKVLTDLQDLEDGKGGMDYKIAGTEDGITAIQMDTKTEGISMDIVRQTILQAKEARVEMLSAMKETIAEPRAELSEYAPRITTLNVHPDKIREIIGPGGKMINAIIDATDVAIDIEDDGLVMVTSTDAEGAKKALAIINEIVREFKPGDMHRGTVSRVEGFGAFVAIDSGVQDLPEGIKLTAHEGLVHISEMAPYRVEKVEDIVNLGDSIPVKVKEIDDMGRISLTLIGTDFKFPEKPDGPIEPRGGYGGGHRGGGRRPGGDRGGNRRPGGHRPRRD